MTVKRTPSNIVEIEPIERETSVFIKMAVKERQNETSFDEIEWNVENEIQLFFAMNGHKPVGKTTKASDERLCLPLFSTFISSNVINFNLDLIYSLFFLIRRPRKR